MLLGDIVSVQEELWLYCRWYLSVRITPLLSDTASKDVGEVGGALCIDLAMMSKLNLCALGFFVRS